MLNYRAEKRLKPGRNPRGIEAENPRGKGPLVFKGWIGTRSIAIPTDLVCPSV